ncbi:MAG TPA: hypothetical protein VGC87_01505 [Pyrinomonadaceae bacterium]|jgi:hypothetical protein
MRPVSFPEPPEIDPDAEEARTHRLAELRAQYDVAVAQLEAARRRKAELQAALVQLGLELSQVQPQVAPAQQDAAAKLAAADAPKPRLEELRAARDAATARLLGGVDTRQPLLLFPVRLETRFMRPSPDAPATELWVRVYPDDVHIDTHEPALTADEQRWGTYFQTQARLAGSAGEDAKRRAWRQLVERFGVRRAAWIARVFNPDHPLNVGTRSSGWTRAPYTKVLPDRWVAVAYRGDRPALTVWGKSIGDVLPTGPGPATGGTSTLPPADASLPSVDDGMRWMIDFKVAEDAGMALRLPLSDNRGFERLLVFGIKSLDAASAAERLAELLDAQHYTQGLALLPQNVPTNNTAQSPSGYGAADRDAEAAYTVELGAALIAGGPMPAANDRRDGHWLAWALGLPASAFEHIRYADGTEQRDARSMNRQLWPQDTPWLRRLLVEGLAGGVADFAREHFASYVIARGPLPALRVGNQPYGVLPVASFARFARRARPEAETNFLQRLNAWQGVWRRSAAAAPGVARRSDLITLMAESGNSCRYLIQNFADGTAQTTEDMTAAALLPKLLPPASLKAWPAEVAQALLTESLDACSHRVDAWVTSLATRRLDELRRANPAAIRLGGYGWVEDVRPATAQWQPAPTPAGVVGPVFQTADNMGFAQAPSLAHAATAAILRSGYLSHRDEGEGNPFAVNLSSDRVRRAEWLLAGVRQGQSLGALLGYRFERRLHERSLDRYIARFRTLAGIKENDQLTQSYAAVREKEKLDEEVRALRDEAARESASAASWRTLRQARQSTRQQYQGLIDGYLKLKNQDVPAAALAVANASAAVTSHRLTNPQSVLRKRTVAKLGGGTLEIVEAIELVEETDVVAWRNEQTRLENVWQQAKITETELRRRSAEAEPSYKDALAQVARLDDQQNEQSIPAAQAAETEHQQAAEALDRQATALEGTPGHAEQDLAAARLALARALKEQWQKALESVAANNVVDGLELRRRWTAARQFTPPRWDATTIPFGDTTLGFPAPATGDFKMLDAQFGWLDEMVDAVGDLVLAESTYHLVQGNPLRSGATLDAISGGEAPPPEMEVIRTPRTGVGLTHRLLVLFPKLPNYAVPAWPTDANQVRAAAEPVLNAWAALLLPNPAKVSCRVEYVNHTTGQVVGTTDVLLTSLALSPLDVVYTTSSPQGAQRTELEERLRYHVARTKLVPSGADIRPTYGRAPTLPADNFSLGELVEVARTVRALLAGARTIDSRDLAAQSDAPDAGISGINDLSSRTTAARQLLANALAALRAALTAARGTTTGSLDPLRNALLQAAAFGVAGTIPLAATGDTAEARADLVAQADSAAQEVDVRLQRIAKLTVPPGATAEALRDYELTRWRELFGADFRTVVWLAPPNAVNLKQSFANSLTLQGNNALESVTWFQRVACVRDGAARLHDALAYGEALGTGAKLDFKVGQLPYKSGDRWAALKGTVSAGRLSLVAHTPLPQAVSFDQPFAGLLIDEWNEMVPSASEVTGLTFHFDQPNACAPQSMLLAVAPDDRPVWDLDTLQATLSDTLTLARARAFAADGHVEVSWAEGRLPRGAQTQADNDIWQWVTNEPRPLAGGPAHQSAVFAAQHQHYFLGATDTLQVGVGDTLYAYAFLDPVNPPREVMLQWNDGGWEHRAYWGENLIAWGIDNSASRRSMGALPPAGQWVRLEVPAALVGLEGRELNGMAFTLWGGRVTWERAGKITMQPAAVDAADERNGTVWFDDRLPLSATLSADSDLWQWVSRDPAALDGSFAHQSSVAAGIHQHYFVVGSENVWVDDQLPPGAVAEGTGESWLWVSQNPAPQFGNVAHQSALVQGVHQHYFFNAPPMRVGVGDTFYAYAFLDPLNPPREVMLQWNDGGWEHRAYWGENLIAWGVDESISRRYMGPLPALGQWVRLETPARLVGLEGRDINGMAFSLWDGRATWDRAGIAAPRQDTLKVSKGDLLYADVFLDPSSPPREVMLQWNDGGWEHRAYWGENLITWGIDNSASRRSMGALPPAGQWVRLAVPASAVGLDGREVRGMSFALSNGRATWNRAGTLSGPLVPAFIYTPGVI